jgi:cytochrome c oxidase cbb3-type subunit III
MNPSPDRPAPETIDGAEPRLTGHEYDGIVEYDNPMPAWWRRMFWATFVFSFVYYVHYQLTGNGASVEDSYATEMREQRERLAASSIGPEINEEALTRLMHDAAMMKDARALYLARCAQCHADRGQGNIGPNLTDEHWIYGSATLMDMLEIIGNGRPLKGMPVWSRTLRPVELAELAAYVGTMRLTRVPGRPPQGTRMVPAADPVVPAAPAAPAAQHVSTAPTANVP